MSENLLIWVDEQDNIIGYGEKLDTHIRSQLHRAFSIFIYDFVEKKMLIQKRAQGKYHSGGLWSNACCSHPLKDAGTLMEQIGRSLERELGVAPVIRKILKQDCENQKKCGITVDSGTLYYAGVFQYEAKYTELSEHEIDRVFLYCPDQRICQQISLNPEEASEYRWISVEELTRWLDQHPEEFSAWFPMAYKLILGLLEQVSC